MEEELSDCKGCRRAFDGSGTATAASSGILERLLGNPIRGNGYHTGYGEGRRDGWLIGAVGVVAFGAIAWGVKWGAGKLQQEANAKHVSLPEEGGTGTAEDENGPKQ
jgi:hypothetical protein